MSAVILLQSFILDVNWTACQRTWAASEYKDGLSKCRASHVKDKTVAKYIP